MVNVSDRYLGSVILERVGVIYGGAWSIQGDIAPNVIDPPRTGAVPFTGLQHEACSSRRQPCFRFWCCEWSRAVLIGCLTIMYFINAGNVGELSYTPVEVHWGETHQTRCFSSPQVGMVIQFPVPNLCWWFIHIVEEAEYLFSLGIIYIYSI